jgi:hypothetical protein
LPLSWQRKAALVATLAVLVPLGTRVIMGAVTSVENIDILAAQSQKKVGGTAATIPDPETVTKIIETAKEYTAASDTIFVMGGYAPEIHILTQRPPASRFVTGNFVEQYYPGHFGPLGITAERGDELLTDIKSSKPQLIFDPCELGYICHDVDYVKELLQAYLDRHYTEISEGIYLRNENSVLAADNQIFIDKAE